MDQAGMGLITFFVGALGACLGSFLNVCIYRIPREESIVWPGSHCTACNARIAWYDNLPLLSYFILRGKCRRCGARYSARYVVVEALTAALFLAVWFRYGLDARTPVYWLAMMGLILGTFVDFEHYILPDRVTIGGTIIGLLLSPLVPALHGEATWRAGLVASVIGAVVGGGLLWLVATLGTLAFKREAMGLGDVKLMAAVGALCGWKAVLFTVVMSSFAGSIAGIGLIAAGRKEWQSRIPYGPFIALAAALWMLGGADWWIGYAAWLFGWRHL